jgi:hypothetical protein
MKTFVGPRTTHERWPSTPPRDCPFSVSTDFTGIAFTERHAEYEHADTWYPTWATDGNLYSPWTDGDVGGWPIGSLGLAASTGNAKIVGGDPQSLAVIPLGGCFGSPLPYGGRYPCGSLVKDGVWYYGTYCLDESGRGLNWDVLGPFVGFRVSHDLGLTWTESPHTPSEPIFGESGKGNAKVKIGAPHFVDFGQNMEHSPDGKAYLVAHGATSTHADLSWISGDQVYLIRVEPTPETINDPSSYEFYAGTDETGQPSWATDLAAAQPLIEWRDRCGCATVTYAAPLKKYLMCVTDGWPTISTMNTFILESDAVTGPWKLLVFMENFGAQAYFVNLPSKFISPDGRTAWVCYSANFTNMAKEKFKVLDDVPVVESRPVGGRYGLCLQEAILLVE